MFNPSIVLGYSFLSEAWIWFNCLLGALLLSLPYLLLSFFAFNGNFHKNLFPIFPPTELCDLSSSAAHNVKDQNLS